MAKKTPKKQTKRNNRTSQHRILNSNSLNCPIDKKFGRFTADGVCVEETAINNKVLRVTVKTLINGIVKTHPKQLVHLQSHNYQLLGIDKKSILNKRTRSNYRPEYDPLRINTRLVQTTKRKMATMSSIEAMIPEFKINKSIKKSTRTSTTTTTTYKYQLKSINSFNYEPSKLCLDFVELPKMLSSIKLPDPSWKIKIFMKDIMTMSISITNSQTPERCVVFTAKNQFYQIIIDGVPVRLLGCPKTLSDPKDFETLIQIVSCISIDDCMVSPITNH